MRRITRMLGLGLVLTAAIGAAGCSEPGDDADPDDFSYDSWHVSYSIDVDDEGRSVAEVTETLVARFPDFDQSRGVVRGIPVDFQGASTDPRDFDVTDENGEPIPFELEEEDGFIAVIAGDEFVHGRQSYVIEYTLSDVILARDDGTADEFSWDLVDFEHLQPIDEFTAEIVFSERLASRLNGNARCYVGEAYSKDECGIAGDAGVFGVGPLPLGPRQGVTVGIGLEPGAAHQPPARVPSFAFDRLPLIVGAAALLAGLGAGAATVTMRLRRRRVPHAIVAQYEVEDGLPPLVAADLVSATGKAVPAEIVHLAVRGALRIEDGKRSGRRAEPPVLRLVDASRAGDPLDRRALNELFGAKAAAGATVALPKRDQEFAQRMKQLADQGRAQALARGYVEKTRSRLARALALAALALTAALAALLVAGAVSGRGSETLAIGLVAGIVAAILAASFLPKQRMLTPEGAEARAHLLGVREFIRVAEADRLRALQSYTGAERTPEGEVDVIRVYERLLPYAMLLGLEKSWIRVLEVSYEQTDSTPYWFPALAVHGLGGFSSTMSHFTTSLNSAVAYTSSSSGGSTGGGFAGGGGGGGFSGGH